MPFAKTPTFLLTVIILLAGKLWYRREAKTPRWWATSGTPTARPSQTSRLPQEVVELIISYFIHDRLTLLACSVTCYSWYIAAVPHHHHTLSTELALDESKRYRLSWPRPLQSTYNLGLLPLVKLFRIRLYRCENFTPKQLDSRTKRYFSALTNLRELGMDNLQVSSFMPDIQRLFGHFSTTLRFLALKDPRGSCRQILYFIGLFPNLQDLKLCYELPTEEQEGTADEELVPVSTPPLRGRLTLTCFTREKLMEDMIALFGGLRFRYMDLFRVKCARLVLDACRETLEILRLYPTDLYENGQAVCRDIDLSRNKSLRTLETTAEAMTARDASPTFFRTILATITSPLPLDFVVVYGEYEVDCRVPTWLNTTHVWDPPAETESHNSLCHRQRFKVFREMYGVREFRLVLCADVLDCVVDDAIETLEFVVEAEKARGGSDYLRCEPLVISERRSPRIRHFHGDVGQSGRWDERVRTSAL